MDDGVVAEGGEDHGKAPRFWLKETDGINHGTDGKYTHTVVYCEQSSCKHTKTDMASAKRANNLLFCFWLSVLYEDIFAENDC